MLGGLGFVAARRQGVTVNAVSRRRQQLEQAVCVKLVERTTRRSAPTEAGLRLYRARRWRFSMSSCGRKPRSYA